MDGMNDELLAVLPRLDRQQLERVATLFIDTARYFDNQHEPEQREQLEQLSCSGETWCIGDYGRTCEAHTAEIKPWCRCCGFDCDDCDLVIEVRKLLAEVPA